MARLRYELSFKGTATDTLAAAFDDCEVERCHGLTVVRATMSDSTSLEGLIARVRALGLELLDAHLVADAAKSDEIWESGP